MPLLFSTDQPAGSKAFLDALDAVAADAASTAMRPTGAGSRMQDVLGDFPTVSPKPTRATGRSVVLQDRPNDAVSARSGRNPYAAAGILSPHEWGKKAHPELAMKDRVPRRTNARLRQEYAEYVDRTLAIQELGRRRQKDVTYVQEAEKERDLRREIAGMRATTKGAGRPLDDLAQAAIEELRTTGRPGPKFRMYQRMKAPSVGVTPRAGKLLFEELAGRPSSFDRGTLTGGMLQEIQAEPVKGWLDWSRRVDLLGRSMHPEDAAAYRNVLEAQTPTPEQVIEAHRAGDITDEEQAELLQAILPPDQLRRLLERKGAKANKERERSALLDMWP